MQTTLAQRVDHSRRPPRLGVLPPLLFLVWPLLTLGCGPVEESSEPWAPGTSAQELRTFNSISPNGLAFNGLAFNGLAFNGLAFNGLTSESFTSWFQSNPEQAEMTMRYVVQCAVPAGEVRTYTHGQTTYTWEGRLGLTPDWASGEPSTVREQQLISACLAAHTNKYGLHVAISVLGTKATGHSIPYSHKELKAFSVREACFFGNLFTGEGIFVGNDSRLLDRRKSSIRACALSSGTATSGDGDEEDCDGDEDEGGESNQPQVCQPMVHVGSCQQYCQRDSTKTYYTRCTVNGVTYRPITTRIRKQDIYTCGDGICQPSESCGRGNTASSCKSDCGRCD